MGTNVYVSTTSFLLKLCVVCEERNKNVHLKSEGGEVDYSLVGALAAKIREAGSYADQVDYSIIMYREMCSKLT